MGIYVALSRICCRLEEGKIILAGYLLLAHANDRGLPHDQIWVNTNRAEDLWGDKRIW